MSIQPYYAICKECGFKKAFGFGESASLHDYSAYICSGCKIIHVVDFYDKEDYYKYKDKKCPFSSAELLEIGSQEFIEIAEKHKGFVVCPSCGRHSLLVAHGIMPGILDDK